MNIIITGGAGFVGSHLVDALLATGHDVTVLDDLSSGSLANLPPQTRFYHKDICAPLDEVFGGVRPDVVVHLAAQVSVPNSVKDPHRDLTVNIGGTVNVMQAAARAGARKFIAFSSAAVYGLQEAMPITEASSTNALSPYGLSKLTAEQYIRLLGNTLGLAYTIIRPANIYGPRQLVESDGAVVPAFLSQFLQGQDPVIHGDGTQTRDFIHVADVVQAVIQSFDRGHGATLNVSSGTECSILELWQAVSRIVGWGQEPVHGRARSGDIQRSVMANDLARKHLQWEPRVPLEAGLAQAVAWYTGGLAEVAAAREC